MLGPAQHRANQALFIIPVPLPSPRTVNRAGLGVYICNAGISGISEKAIG